MDEFFLRHSHLPHYFYDGMQIYCNALRNRLGTDFHKAVQSVSGSFIQCLAIDLFEHAPFDHPKNPFTFHGDDLIEVNRVLKARAGRSGKSREVF